MEHQQLCQSVDHALIGGLLYLKPGASELKLKPGT